jgi:polysaccharide pyruvyl transferase WcaK-like protein
MNKTILYGAFGRYNFGDILFPYIIAELLAENNIKADLEYCDILSRDMSMHGGHKVKSIVDFLDYSDLINVIHVGGQTLGCDMKFVIKMFNPDRNDANIPKLKKISQPAYILSKSDFVKPNKFILNSAGGFSMQACQKIKNYDYISLRDYKSYKKFTENSLENSIHCVDSAILTKRFFENVIAERNTTEHIQGIHKSVGSNYIAVQMNANFSNNNRNSIIKCLYRIILESNLPLVLFAAGTAPSHDKFETYYEFSKHLPKNMLHICESENCWDVCNIISNASFVLGTSLHVRILSMQYFKPRATLSLGDKHSGFIIDWDNIKNISIDLQNVPAYISKSLLNHDIDSDMKQLDFLEQDYIYKSTWIHSL